MAAMDYATFKTQFAQLIVIDETDANFVTMLPIAIQSAEQRIYRDLDLLVEIVSDRSTTMSQGVAEISIPAAFYTIRNLNAISDAGDRYPMTPVSRAWFDMVYSGNPDNHDLQGVPAYFAMITQGSLIMGPPPDSSYRLEVIGTQRPAALSATNTTTPITTYMPDIFIAAAMIYAAGWMKNYGAQGDNPQMAQSWQSQYDMLKQSANIEELQKKFMSQAWSSQAPTPAQPAQG
jgi:hypothetical protein